MGDFMVRFVVLLCGSVCLLEYSLVRGQACDDSDFFCDDGDCIFNWWVCDGEEDCLDGSDEAEAQGCLTRPCDTYETECWANREAGVQPVCILDFWVCDGMVDCTEDGQDEMYCGGQTTLPGGGGSTISPNISRNGTKAIDCDLGYLCSDGSCINETFKCNHRSDCYRGEDEHDCPYPTCSPSQFECVSGQCIDNARVCDKINDCFDRSDEDSGICATPSPICPGTKFDCGNGVCLDPVKVCNNVPNECGSDNNKDEEKCSPGDIINECANDTLNQCTENCMNTLWGYYCTCYEGKRLMDDGVTCTPINECIEPPFICSQGCVDQPVGALCSCVTGYHAHLNNPNKCVKDDDIEPYLLFANQYFIRNLTTVTNEYGRVSDHHTFTHILDYDMTKKKKVPTATLR